MLFVILLCFLGLLLFGLMSGLLVLLLLLTQMMLLSGLTLLVFWSSGFLFLVLCIGLLEEWTLVLVVFLMLSCSVPATAHWQFGLLGGSIVQLLLLLVRRILLFSPYTPRLLVKWVSFLSSLHWPVGDLDLGVGGVSFVELLILHELWAGERLVLEKAHPRYLRPGRPISVSAVPFGPGIGIWRSCRFIGALMRSLCLLPGGLGRFVPCSIGANHCRLRQVLSWVHFSPS